MKKISFLFLCTVFCTSIFAEPSEKNPNDELRNDPVFVQQVSKQKELLNNIFAGLNYDQASIDAAKKAIEALQNDKSSTDEEMWAKVNSILKLPEGQGLDAYYNDFKNNWSVIRNKYGAKLTDEYIQEETKAAWESEMQRSAYPCRDRAGFVLCSAGVTAIAMTGYAACAGTLFGWPVCAALVAIGQTAGINQCSNEFCGASITSNL